MKPPVRKYVRDSKERKEGLTSSKRQRIKRNGRKKREVDKKIKRK